MNISHDVTTPIDSKSFSSSAAFLLSARKENIFLGCRPSLWSEGGFSVVVRPPGMCVHTRTSVVYVREKFSQTIFRVSLNIHLNVAHRTE